MSDPKRLSVIRNTSLNYLGQAYALLIGILILPFYLGHLGAEVYGLIGFSPCCRPGCNCSMQGCRRRWCGRSHTTVGATSPQAAALPVACCARSSCCCCRSPCSPA